MNYPTLRIAPVLLGATVIITGCAAGAALRFGVGGLGRAAVGRAAVGATARAGMSTAVTSRAIAQASVVRSGLRSLTAGTRAPATVSITRGGAILHRGRHLATIESDGLLVAREGSREYILGRLTQNRLWALNEAGQMTVPLARLRGFVPSRGIAVRSGPTAAAPRIDVLRGNVTAEVVQTSNGWYEIRLPNQSTGWVWGGLLALALLGSDEHDDNDRDLPESATDVSVILTDGHTLVAREMRIESSIVRVWEPSGREYVIDRELVSGTVPLDEAPTLDDAPRVELANGATIIGVATPLSSEAVQIETTSGSTLVVDPRLIDASLGAPAPPAITGSSAVHAQF